MTRAVEQIEQELAALDQTVAALAQALHDTYQQYLTVLGKATRQQLIVAGYHICTHGYPEQFLALSLNRRQELQQTLQHLAKQGQTELLECLNPITSTELTSDDPIESDPAELEEIDQDYFESDPFQAEDDLEDAEQQPLDQPLDQSIDQPNDQPNGQPVDQLSVIAPLQLEDAFQADQPLQPASEPHGAEIGEEMAEDSSDAVQDGALIGSTERPLHPKDIVRWQAMVEDQINEILQTLSHTTNRLLQQADILPSRLPEPVLEVAAKADLSSETAASPPNLLNLLIETDSEDEEKPSMTQVIAIRLRLSEIEFSDAGTAAVRSKVRHLMGQLAKLGREYQRKQKECAVAQAESAWRASWFESEA